MNPNKGLRAADMLPGEQGTKAILESTRLSLIKGGRGDKLTSKSNFQSPFFPLTLNQPALLLRAAY